MYWRHQEQLLADSSDGGHDDRLAQRARKPAVRGADLNSPSGSIGQGPSSGGDSILEDGWSSCPDVSCHRHQETIGVHGRPPHHHPIFISPRPPAPRTAQLAEALLLCCVKRARASLFELRRLRGRQRHRHHSLPSQPFHERKGPPRRMAGANESPIVYATGSRQTCVISANGIPRIFAHSSS